MGVVRAQIAQQPPDAPQATGCCQQSPRHRPKAATGRRVGVWNQQRSRYRCHSPPWSWMGGPPWVTVLWPQSWWWFSCSPAASVTHVHDHRAHEPPRQESTARRSRVKLGPQTGQLGGLPRWGRRKRQRPGQRSLGQRAKAKRRQRHLVATKSKTNMQDLGGRRSGALTRPRRVARPGMAGCSCDGTSLACSMCRRWQHRHPQTQPKDCACL